MRHESTTPSRQAQVPRNQVRIPLLPLQYHTTITNAISVLATIASNNTNSNKKTLNSTGYERYHTECTALMPHTITTYAETQRNTHKHAHTHTFNANRARIHQHVTIPKRLTLKRNTRYPYSYAYIHRIRL